MKLLLLSFIFLLSSSGCERFVPNSKVVALEAQLKKIQDKEEADIRLGQYAINMMYITPARTLLSDGKKQSLAHSIVRVANDIFDTEENRKDFIAVIAIESGFQKYAQSPTGPKGYTQVAKAAFYEALKACGLSNLKDEDVWDTDLNLYAGACYFQRQLIKHNYDALSAIVAYNQGPNRDSAKLYSKSGSLDNKEALKYVAKFAYLKQTATDEKLPNTPALINSPRLNTKKK